MFMKKLPAKYGLPVFIAVVTCVVYLKALHNDFVLWDDDRFVYENPHIRSFDLSFFKWAFTDVSEHFWQPFTWISIAFDYLIWGLNPFGFHLTNVLLHGGNTFLVVVLTRRLLETKELLAGGGVNAAADRHSLLIPAGVTGLLFGIHPLHVESAAFVTARNDMIATLFLLVSLLSYVSYAASCQAAGLRRAVRTPLVSREYLYVTLFFVLALASKPTVVILPAILIILDWYPFGIIRSRADLLRSVCNKLPLISLSAAVSLLTLLLHKSGGGMAKLEMVSFSTRLLLAAKSLVIYLVKMVIPYHLIPYYPMPGEVSLLEGEYLLAVVLVCLITSGCFLAAKKQRLFMAVWAIYVVTLLPVIGIVSVRNVAMADRYTYFSCLGPFLLIGLGAAWLWQRSAALGGRRQVARTILIAMAVVVAASLSILTLRQISIWRNTITLWSHVIEAGPYRVPIAFNNRGIAYASRGEAGLALSDYNTAIDLNPYYADAYYNRGVLFSDKGDWDAAREDLSRAISLKGSDFAPYVKRGLLFEQQGELDKALADFTAAIRLNPSAVEAYINRGAVFRAKGDYTRALLDYGTAVSLDPSNFLAYSNRGIALVGAGKTDEAVDDFTKAISLNPGYAKAYLYRGDLYARAGKTAMAARDFTRACELGSAEACGAVAAERR